MRAFVYSLAVSIFLVFGLPLLASCGIAAMRAVATRADIVNPVNLETRSALHVDGHDTVSPGI